MSEVGKEELILQLAQWRLRSHHRFKPVDDADFALPRIKIIPPSFDQDDEPTFDDDGNVVENPHNKNNKGLDNAEDNGSIESGAMSQLSAELRELPPLVAS